LEEAIRRMARETEREIQRLYTTPAFRDWFAMDISVSAQARILAAALMRKFDDYFASIAKPTAEEMVSGANKASHSSVRMSLFELSKGLTLDPKDAFTPEIKELMSAAVTENVGLIKSIASRYLDQVQGAVMRSITTGNGLADLMPFLQKQYGIAKRRAEFISLDQTRKAYSALSVVRCRDAGIEQFEWLHSSSGQHPRKEHVEMSGHIFRVDSPPVIDRKTGERGFPGQLPNCRCVMCPVVSFDSSARSP
jgi:SPP1 gp7 family putative phage head morphogenesis protein